MNSPDNYHGRGSIGKRREEKVEGEEGMGEKEGVERIRRGEERDVQLTEAKMSPEKIPE